MLNTESRHFPSNDRARTAALSRDFATKVRGLRLGAEPLHVTFCVTEASVEGMRRRYLRKLEGHLKFTSTSSQTRDLHALKDVTQALGKRVVSSKRLFCMPVLYASASA